MDTADNVPSMALYLMFFSCLATIMMATWKIFDKIFDFIYSKEHGNIIETHPIEIGFVLWGHCQNLLDDPRKQCILCEIKFTGF